MVLVVVATLAGTGIWLARDNSGDEAPTGQSTSSSTRSTTATTPTTAAVPTVVATQLDSMLLGPAQINGIVGTSGIVVEHESTDMRDPGPKDSLSDEQCRGALVGFQTHVYNSSGYTAMKAQLMQKPGSSPGYAVVQGAVIFSSADQALGFVTSQATQWRNCTRKPVTQINNGTTFHWTLLDVTGDPPKISLQRTLANGNGVDCEHVLNAVSNVVLDVNACAPQATDQATKIAEDMAANVPK